MAITIGTLQLSDGTRAQPARITGGSGARAVQPSRPVRADAKVYDRQGRSFEESLQVDYTYATHALARAGWVSRRNAALSEPKGAYVDGPTTVGSGLIDQCRLVYIDGCGITIEYHITGELP